MYPVDLHMHTVASTHAYSTLHDYIAEAKRKGIKLFAITDHGPEQFVGEFTGERNGPLAAVAVKNKFSVGDSLELMTPQGNVNFTLEHMENGKGETMPVAPGDGYTVWLPVPDDLPLQYALLMRNFTGQTTRNPHGN